MKKVNPPKIIEGKISFKEFENYLLFLIKNLDEPHDEYSSGYNQGISEFYNQLLINLKEQQ